MNRIAIQLTEWFIKNDIVNKSERDASIYSWEIILGKMLTNIMLLAISMIQKNTLQTLLYMFSFFSLRGYTGGFHAKRRSTCCAVTLAAYFIVCKWYVPILESDAKLFFLTMVVSVFSIIMFAPLNHPNLCLNKKEMKLCKKTARQILAFWWVIANLFRILKIIPEYNSYLTAGIGVDAGLLILGKIRKQEVRKSE